MNSLGELLVVFLQPHLLLHTQAPELLSETGFEPEAEIYL